jgi:hypothetical protein
MHWHCPLWVPPPPSTTSSEFPPCSCSLFEVCYALYSKYPSLLLNLSNTHLSLLSLLTRNPFLVWCSPNLALLSIFWYFFWLHGVIPIFDYFHCSHLAKCFEFLLLFQSSLQILNISILLIYNMFVLDIHIKKFKQNICHLYTILCRLLKHSSNSSMLI